MLKQPLPAAWRGLSFAERKAAVEDYSREIVAYLRKTGLRGHLYAIGNEIDFGKFGDLVSRLAAAIDRPVVVAETDYPGTTDFTGQFSGWKHEAPGYPLTPEGQRRWLADFSFVLRF